MVKLDLTGQIFGALTVLAREGETASSRWKCQCLCGENVVCHTGVLRQMHIARCGCAGRANRSKQNTTHGLTRTAEYRCWAGIKTRCLNPKAKSFRIYGGRGVTISDEWRSFENFLADMGKMPGPGYTIERKNSDGPYTAENCRWATKAEQSLNIRSNHLLTFNGKTAPLAVWAREVGLEYDTLERRINLLGWSIERALTSPARGWGPGKPRPT